MLLNTPIIIVIPSTLENPISEENFNEQAAIVKKYVASIEGLRCNITMVPLVNGTTPENFRSHLPWYDGPDLSAVLSKITKRGNFSSEPSRFLVTKKISNWRCFGMLRQGSVKVADVLDTLMGKVIVKSMKINGENINSAIRGTEIELELAPATDAQLPSWKLWWNPSLKTNGLIGPGVKSVKEMLAIVRINRIGFHGFLLNRGTRNGVMMVIKFLGGPTKVSCRIEVQKMLEFSERQYILRKNSQPPEKYYYSTYNFLRKTLDRGVLGLVKLIPRKEQSVYVMTIKESADLSTFHIKEGGNVVGMGVVIEATYN